jgi:G3E family GTPase
MALDLSLTSQFIDDRIPVTLLTGFLGSGKTTVLNRLLLRPNLNNTAVIINEFGEIGLDHELVTAVTENMVLLQSGCLCCSIRGDLIETLHDLLEKSALGDITAFDRVIIETTGLADPAPILHTLMTDQVLATQFRLDGIITTIDAATAPATLDTQIESVKQAAVADRLLLTKTDLVPPDAVRAIEARLASINPGAAIIRAYNGVVDPAKLFNIGLFDPASKGEDVQAWLNQEAYGEAGHSRGAHHHDVNRHDDRIKAVCLTIDHPISMPILDIWLDTLMSLQGPDLLRMKGLINIEDAAGPMLIHGVQHIFHPPVLLNEWPSADHSTRIVLIARDIPARIIEDSLAFLRSTAAGGGTAPLSATIGGIDMGPLLTSVRGRAKQSYKA